MPYITLYAVRSDITATAELLVKIFSLPNDVKSLSSAAISELRMYRNALAVRFPDASCGLRGGKKKMGWEGSEGVE